jgi:hypothetical protein
MILSKTDNLGQCTQPGCHGTPGYHKEPPDCHFQQIMGAANFFIDLKGAANQKRLKNIDLGHL